MIDGQSVRWRFSFGLREWSPALGAWGCTALLFWSVGFGTTVIAEEATLYRDTWGVPHVFAGTETAGLYALGYAQAEDRLRDIYLAIRTGIGRMAEVTGPDALQQDYLMRLAGNDSLHAPYLKEAPAHLREALVAFTAGIQAYIDEHPGEAADVALPLEPWHPLAVGRAMILRWPIGAIMSDLKNSPDKAPPAMGSNQWAVAPQRTVDGAAILLSDPHLTWEGLAVLYEARVHAGALHMNGYYLIGSPMLAIGHNQRVGWALTTGGPDTSDVYRMQLRLEPRPQYLYDDQWRDLEVKEFSIPVAASKMVKRTALYTHLGPVVSEPDPMIGIAYVGASPYLTQTGLYDQFYKMAMANNVYEVNAALAMHQYNEQNVMAADVEGNVSYVRNGATPIRPAGFDWSRPVDGTTSTTAWLGIHPQSDLVHIVNPPQGYMQNCNISPANMMVNSPLTPDKYPPYIYNVSWDQNNPRGRRTVELLEGNQKISQADALSIAMDVFDRSSPVWQKELRDISNQAELWQNFDATTSKELQQAIALLLQWDGRFTATSQGTVLYKVWRLKCGEQCDLTPLANDQSLSPETRHLALRLLAESIVELNERYGRYDLLWGDVHVVGRGGQYFPASGADFSSGNRDLNFVETLLDVRSNQDPNQPGRFIANNGSMAMILMFFDSQGVRSFTCTPWGQSAHSDSPHFMDQGEKLYGHGKMKPTWWKREELLQNIESSRVLQY